MTSTVEQSNYLYNYYLQDKNNVGLFCQCFQAQIYAAQFERCKVMQSSETAQLLVSDPAWLHLLGEYQIAASLLDDAELTYRQLLASQPALNSARINLAQVFAFKKLYTEAEQLISVLPMLELPKEGFQLRLRLHYLQGNIDQVIEECSIWLTRVNPDDVDVAGLLSTAYLDQGNEFEARKWAEKALSIQPNSDAITTIGMLNLNNTDAEYALAEFKKALALNPRDGRAWFGVAAAELQQRNRDGAEQALHYAQEYFAGYIGTWHVLGWISFNKGEQALAKKYFERSLELNRNFAETHGGLAAVAVAQGKFEIAKKEIATALKLDKQSVAAWYAQSLLLKAIGQTQESEEIMQRLLAQELPNGSTFSGILKSYIVH